MILGDNIFYGRGFAETLREAAANAEDNGRATVFGYYVPDPERFGVVDATAGCERVGTGGLGWTDTQGREAGE